MAAPARLRTGGYTVSVDLEAFDLYERDLKAVRNRLNRSLDDEAAQAAKLTVLPTGRRKAGNLKVDGSAIGQSLVVRRIRGGARLTTKLRGIKGRTVGLLEFGGTVGGTIRPKTRHALMLRGSDHPVANVKTMRHYRARRFMVGARDEKLGAFAEELRDRVVGFFREIGFEVD